MLQEVDEASPQPIRWMQIESLPRPRICDTLEKLYNTILSYCTVSQPTVDWEKASIFGLPTLKKQCAAEQLSHRRRTEAFFVFCERLHSLDGGGGL